MRKIFIEKEKLQKLYNQEKQAIYQIAELYGCSPALISKRLKKYNISTWWNPVIISKEILEELYCQKGLSIAEIARHFNCGPTTIIGKMHSFGIVSRKKIILLSTDVLEELYHNQILEQKQIANLLWCEQATISNKMKEAGIKARDKSEVSTKYPKYDFSGDPIEKAYLIGFRLGDLHVRKHRHLIRVECTTTRLEQIDLIKGLFEKYTYVRINTNKRGMTQVSCLLNKSFDFLLEKNDNVPTWILDNNNLFLSCFAGYTDAEGCVGIYRDKKERSYVMFILRTYDKIILSQFRKKLLALNIVCPKSYLCTPSGKQNNNNDFWKLGVYRKDSLIKLFVLIENLVKHPRIISGIKRSRQVL